MRHADIRRQKSVDWNGWGWGMAQVLVWGVVFWHLSREWRSNPAYAFGFSVPVLALCLAWVRWGLGQVGSFSPRPVPRLEVGLACGLLWLGFLLREVDPFWRPVSYVLMTAATWVTWMGLRTLGGVGFARLMLFPLCFTWTALPWPSGVEDVLTSLLLRISTALTVDGLNAVGIAALQRGTVIELRQGVIGVTNACSGFQALQAGIMAALFMGDLHRLSWRRRLVLLLLAVAVVVVGNALRIWMLARIGAGQGLEAVEARHGMTGYFLSGLSFVCVSFLAWGLRVGSLAGGGVNRSWNWRTPDRCGWLVVGAVCVIPGVVSGWFAWRGATAEIQPKSLWVLDPSTIPAGWRVTSHPVPAEIIHILNCSEAEMWRVHPPISGEIQVFHFFWKPGIEVPSPAVGHTPDICMPRAGWELLMGPVSEAFRLRGREVFGAGYRFRQETAEMKVWQLVSRGGRLEKVSQTPRVFHLRWDRLSALWSGKRNRGQETLTLIQSGSNRPEMFQRVLDAMSGPSESGLP